jgi:hypothetical protein
MISDKLSARKAIRSKFAASLADGNPRKGKIMQKTISVDFCSRRRKKYNERARMCVSWRDDLEKSECNTVCVYLFISCMKRARGDIC